VVEVPVRNNNCIGIRCSHRKLWRIAGQHPEVEQKRIVYENRASADLAGSSEKLHVHYRSYADRTLFFVGSYENPLSAGVALFAYSLQYERAHSRESAGPRHTDLEVR
jgi:hypothetical protein